MFGRYSFLVSTVTQTIIRDFSDLSQLLQANKVIEPRLGYHHFLPNPLQFIIHQPISNSIPDFENYLNQTAFKVY
jgi:hypothetical protein